MAQAIPDLPAARAVDLIRNGDLNTLTFKAIMGALEREFGQEIRSRKSELRQLVNTTIEQMHKTDDSGEESEPEVESPAEIVPRSSKRKAARSPRRSSGKRIRSESGLQKAIGISSELAAFLGVEPDEHGGTRMARTEVTKRMIRYVKENSLQSPADGRKIICDEHLRALLGVDEITFFTLQKVLSPHFEKSSAKSSAKSNTTSGKRSGKGSGKSSAFHKPYAMSGNLQAMLGVSEPMSRPQIVKAIWSYIKGHNLQNPNDKRFILCDDAMKAVFKCNNLHMMKMNKILSDHITAVEVDALPESDRSMTHDEYESAAEAADVKPNIKNEPDVKREQF